MANTQRQKRVRRSRNIFSPSDNWIRPSHYLLYFDSTDSYTIALSSSINSITGTTATLNIRGRKTLATIITSGSLECCEDEQRKRTRESQQTSDDNQLEALNWDDNEDVTFDSSPHEEGLVGTFLSSNSQSRTRITHQAHSLLNDEDADSDANPADNNEKSIHQVDHSFNADSAFDSKRKSIINRKKRKQTPVGSKKPKRQRKNFGNDTNEGDEQVMEDVHPPTCDGMNTKNVLTQIENHIAILQSCVTKNLKRMEKKIDYHLSSNPSQGSKTLDQYRFERGEIFVNEYNYRNYNLLATPSRDLFDFARRTMKILFSPEELKNHTLPPGREHLKRPALDQERFSILIEAIRIKFRLDSDLMQQCFNDLLRTKLANFLYEERRRELRRRLRDKERMLKHNMLQPISDDQDESFD